MSWQPMASAPRDGQRFVAGLWIGAGATAQFEMHIIRATQRGDGIHPDDDRGWSWSDYSHWMPLPIPSASAGTVGGIATQKAAVPAMHKAYGLG